MVHPSVQESQIAALPFRVLSLHQGKLSIARGDYGGSQVIVTLEGLMAQNPQRQGYHLIAHGGIQI